MGFIEKEQKSILNRNVKIVLTEGTEATIIRAAAKIVDYGFAIPVLVGQRNAIEKIAVKDKISLSGVIITEPDSEPKKKEYARIFSEQTGFPLKAAEIMMAKPLYFGSMMVHTGDADAVMSGIATETAEVISAYKLILGMQEGIETPSSFVLLEVPGYEGPQGNMLMFADTALNIDPDAKQLADIAIASARSAKDAMGWDPRVAMLSFSTCGSASHERAKKVANAVQIVRERVPELAIDGEMQLDAAIVPEVAKRKIKYASNVAGKANVLIFPSLEAGNIGSKLVQRLAGAKSYGAVLQGFSAPASDLSRGASETNILGIAVLLAKAANANYTEK